MRLLIIFSFVGVWSCTPDDETAFLQVELSMPGRRHAKSFKQSSAQDPIDEYDDLVSSNKKDALEDGHTLDRDTEDMEWQFKHEDVSRLSIGSIVGFQATYKWGQRLSRHPPSNDGLASNNQNSPQSAANATKLTNNQSTVFVIKGFHPKGKGPFPVYIGLSGEHCDFDGGANLDMVRHMAERGYLAATVQYDNGQFCADFCADGGKCDYEWQGHYYTDHRHYFNDTTSKITFGSVTIFEKARGVRNALDVLCDTTHAACSKGVAVSGFSQGAWIVSALSLLDSRISALLLFGVGLLEDYEVLNHPPWHKLVRFNQSCLQDESMSKHVPRARRRYVDGSRDKLIGHYRQALSFYSGYHCENNTFPINCLQPDGSGYYIVSLSQYTAADEKSEHRLPLHYVDGTPFHRSLAGHNFFSNTRPIDKEGKLLPTFKEGNSPWCFKPSFGWLAKAALMHDQRKVQS